MIVVFGSSGLPTAIKTVENFLAQAIRLYERESGEPSGSARLGKYVQRWSIWGCGLGYPTKHLIILTRYPRRVTTHEHKIPVRPDAS
jgi:hypothetical protein